MHTRTHCHTYGPEHAGKSQYRLRRIYKIIKSRTGNSKKSKKHMYAGREYSNAIWHVDLKDPRFAGIHLVTHLDDSSGCVMAARLFTHATFDNAVLVLRNAIKQFKVPAIILSDNGSCFAGVGRQKSVPKSWMPAALGRIIIK